MEPKLKENGLRKLFDEIEMPLVSVLAGMEKNGIKVDVKFLEKLSEKTADLLSKVEDKIYKISKTKFNINSPIQLKEVLFEKLKISTEGIKHTKTGLSTAASELEKLRHKHKIIDLIFDHRELSKLRSTYIETLPKLINPYTSRVHTSFNQTVTTTGRLSSTPPST